VCQADGLDVGGLATAIGAGEDHHPTLGIEGGVIEHNLLGAPGTALEVTQCQEWVVEPFDSGGALAGGGQLWLAGGQAGRLQALNQPDGAQVEGELGL